jgi:metal-responsive CopG/Arc/MetJ family transcriptional regulator
MKAGDNIIVIDIKRLKNMRGKTKKATFNLPVELLEALDEIMAEGIVPSKNALVENALIKEVQELKRQQRKELWTKAMKDPLFIRDIEKADADFKFADAESAGKLEE